MRLTIDNLDGLGAQDYTASVSGNEPIKVIRTLNAPSTCACLLDLSATGLPSPRRSARVVVTSEDDLVLFTGYLSGSPALVFAGQETRGTVYLHSLKAVSDEWLLDRQVIGAGGQYMAQTGGSALGTLMGGGSGGLLATSNLSGGRPIGVLQPDRTKAWSANAGELAGAAYGAYRAVAGAVELVPVGSVTHVLRDGDGTLDPASLSLGSPRDLANDITVSGEIEPTAFVTEIFVGDGSTSEFVTSQAPFGQTSSTTAGKLLSESFNSATPDPKIWTVADPGSHLSLTSSGLTISGGNGQDGQTLLLAKSGMEVGGTLLLEMGVVQLGTGSDGVVCGLYNGTTTRAGCFAGFNVRQASGATIVSALVNGSEAGTSFTLLNGHRYTLRLRVHCPELHRVRQVYYAMTAGTVQSFGGGLVDAEANLVFDVQDLGAASNSPSTVLYDGRVASAPATSKFAAVNSVQLVGSIGYCRVTQSGSAWVSTAVPGAASRTRLIGGTGEGVDCMVSTAGKISFFPGRVPVAGERITVVYRGRQRSVARMYDAASEAREGAGGVPGTAQWIGKVISPVARNSADCESAAMALLALGTDDSAATGGQYEAVNGPDIWPGDLVAITRAGTTSNSIVKQVSLEDGMSAPETIVQKLGFADAWKDGLGLKISTAIASDAELPASAQSSPGQCLADLRQLLVLSVDGATIQIDAGEDPPDGGGFEVRRRDGAFGTAVDQDLVLRSPVRGFSVPRAAQVERYYVRMFDRSVPARYSRVSSAVFVDVPVE